MHPHSTSSALPNRLPLPQKTQRAASLAALRFGMLRATVPASELPTYKHREHFRGRDAELVEQVLAEMVREGCQGDEEGVKGKEEKEGRSKVLNMESTSGAGAQSWWSRCWLRW